jgi:uncharacterized membrane protein YbhN (UPF0104 family)
MLSRLRASAWVRAALLAIVLAFCGYGLYKEWPQVSAGLSRLHWYAVALSLAACMAGSFCLMLAWRAILADLGSRLPVRAAAKINFIAQLGKYVPGAVWAIAAQVELARNYKVPRQRSIAAIAVGLAVSVGAGLSIAAIALPLSSAGLSRYYWTFAAVPVIAACLLPPVLGRLIDRGLTLARQAPLDHRPTWPGLARALAWTLLGWLLFGIQIWLLLGDMTGRHGYLLLAIGGYALAFSLGLLLVIFPSGIGPREVILIATLVAVVPHGTAVAIALAARVVTTGSDLAWGGTGLLLRLPGAAASALEAPDRESAALDTRGPDAQGPESTALENTSLEGTALDGTTAPHATGLTPGEKPERSDAGQGGRAWTPDRPVRGGRHRKPTPARSLRSR